MPRRFISLTTSRPNSVSPPWRALSRLQTVVGHDHCVVSDSPAGLIELDRLDVGFSRGCPDWVDVTGKTPVEAKGFVPPNRVVIPGSRPKAFPAGTFGVPCALIIGRRKPSTDTKTSLNDALREFGVAV